MKTRPVNILMSKKVRMVVVCQQCPISPNRIAGNQKTACMHLLPLRDKESGHKKLVKHQVCQYYAPGSIKKLEYGINALDCNFD